MMRAEKTGASMALARLCDRVEAWRAERPGGLVRVPDDIWREAVVVARAQGVHATSKALRFNYYSLKERLDRSGDTTLARPCAPRKRAATARVHSRAKTFVEVRLPSTTPISPATSPSPASQGATVVEFADASGRRMRIDIAGASLADVASLVQTFWRGER